VALEGNLGNDRPTVSCTDEIMGENADRVIITDVTLREYGQNVPSDFLDVFSPQRRIDIAQSLIRLGFRSIEVLSCVHPRIAPAMSEEAIKTIGRGLGRVGSCDIITLVPNNAGYGRFLSYGFGPDGYNHSAGVFFSAVEAHNLLNLGCSIRQTLEEVKGIAKDAVSRGVKLVAYLSAAFGFRESETGNILRVGAQEIAGYLDLLFDLGAATVTLSDLQGVAGQEETRELLDRSLSLRKGRDIGRIGYHPHHVSGPKALANSMAAYDIGIRRFDASLGGTGGCVTGAPGNQPTEALVGFFEEKGIKTGLNPEEVSALADFVEKELYREIVLPVRKSL
jgi:hydroxymethylglutaryl-CoA lyase